MAQNIEPNNKTDHAGIMDFEYIIKNNLIEQTLLNQAAAQNIDLYECKINPFKALLQETGAILFSDKKILRLNRYNNNKYNIPVPTNEYNMIYINKICDIYIYISQKYNKCIGISYFGYLLNMNYNDIYNVLNINTHDNNIEYNGINFNNLRNNIIKRLRAERENNLKEKCIESPGAVGAIAIGNVENGWNLTPGQRSQDNNNNNMISVNSLPQINAIETAGNGTKTAFIECDNEKNETDI